MDVLPETEHAEMNPVAMAVQKKAAQAAADAVVVAAEVGAMNARCKDSGNVLTLKEDL